MECSFMLPNRGIPKRSAGIIPELLVETVMEEDEPGPSSSKPIFMDTKAECTISKIPLRPFFSRIVTTEEDKKEDKKIKIPFDKILSSNNLKSVFQDVYYKNISKDRFLKELYKEKPIDEEFPFVSNCLNEYLQNNTKLNISFEIPMLYTYDKLNKSPNRGIGIINNCVTVQRITSGITIKKDEQVPELKQLRMPFEIKKNAGFARTYKKTGFFKKVKKYESQKLVKMKSEPILKDEDKLLLSKYNLSKIPFMYKCDDIMGKICCKPPERYRLGIVLNIGPNRPIPEEQEINLNYETIINPMHAAIAVSAVVTHKRLTRLIVPVMPDTDIYSKSSQSLKLTKVSSYDCASIRDEVEKTLNNIVDFVVRQDDFLPIYDYDTEIPDKIIKEKTDKCNKDYCLKGCLCDSLNGKVETKHCENIDCIFGCVCNELRRRTLRNFDDTEELIINGKVRRGCKTPQRYRDYVRNFSLVNPLKSLDDKKDTDYKGTVPPLKKIKLDLDKKRAPKLLGNSEVKGMEWEVTKSIKGQIVDRRFKFCTGKVKERQSLGDVFIWCAVHLKYNCLCSNPVIMLKHNTVIWKPTSDVRYLANKVMFKIFLDSASSFDKEAVPLDLHGECSRTFKGLISDYALRNSDPIFQKKRKYELDNKIMCYSNSYIKCKPFLMLDKNSTQPPLPFDKSSFRNKMKTIILKKNNENEYVDVVGSNDDWDDNSSVIMLSDKEEIIELTDSDSSSKSDADEKVKILESKSDDVKVKILESKSDDVKVKILESKSGDVKVKILESKSDDVKVKILESKSDDIKVKILEKEDENFIPSHGFLCLTPGIGFLELDNSNNKITIQHPRTSKSCKTFNSIEEANEWINVLFKHSFMFEPPNISLQWVVVTQGILKLKKSKPFQSDLFNKTSVVITKNGVVIKDDN